VKERGILNPHLARIISQMGHDDLLCISDAGLPIPRDVERVDLAFAPNQPRFLEVVDAVLSELRVEGYILAKESNSACPRLVEALAKRLPGVEAEWVDHEELKQRTHEVRAVVRTGEFTPFANVLLRSGVDFSANRR
jgi:D-ribose pyranase